MLIMTEMAEPFIKIISCCRISLEDVKFYQDGRVQMLMSCLFSA